MKKKRFPLHHKEQEISSFRKPKSGFQKESPCTSYNWYAINILVILLIIMMKKDASDIQHWWHSTHIPWVHYDKNGGKVYISM